MTDSLAKQRDQIISECQSMKPLYDSMNWHSLIRLHELAFTK